MIPLPLDRPFRIGRSPQNDLVLRDPTVSRHHGNVVRNNEGLFVYEDLGSSTGTWLGTERIGKHVLCPGDLFRIGVQRLRFAIQGKQAFLEHLEALDASVQIPWCPGKPLRIGRDQYSDLHIAHPLCPRIFAELFLSQGTVRIRSRMPAYRRKRETLPFQISLPFGLLHVQPTHVEWIPYASGMAVEALELGALAGERQILEGISFSLPPGEILAVVGRSGHGKSTLLRTLAGERSVDLGELHIHPHSPERIAWLRQAAPLQPYLTVQECIEDSCTLRLPADTGPEEFHQRVDALLAQLGLAHLRKSQTRLLSGGEQRRVALACELVAAPGLVLLDEPFAGLDPVHVKSLAAWFRQLGWAGHTLVLTTHDYAILPHADKVLILNHGKQAYFGSPEGALRQFQSESAAELLLHLEQGSTKTAPHIPSAAKKPPHQESSPPPFPIAHRSPIPMLLLRFLRTLVRDRGRLVATVLQPLVIAILLAQLFHTSSSLWIAAFALNLCINWFGMSGAIREVVAQKDLASQEWARGLSPLLDLGCKWFALFVVAMIQTAICALVLRESLHWQGSPLLLLGLAGAALAAPVAAGLAASALARSAGQANAMLPLLLIPQLMFAGALVPLDQMSSLGRSLAQGMWSRWSQSALQDLLTSTPLHGKDLAIPALTALGIVILCAWVLKAKTTRNIPSTSTKNTM